MKSVKCIRITWIKKGKRITCLLLLVMQPIREVSPEGAVLEGGAPVAHLGVLAQETLEVVPPEARRCIGMSISSMLLFH